MLRPKSRFKSDIVKHLDGYQDVYIRWPIERIHIQEIDLFDLNYVADYAGKTMNGHRVSQDDIIILPEKRSNELIRQLSSDERAMRDFQSKHNVSDEIAGQMLRTKMSKNASSK